MKLTQSLRVCYEQFVFDDINCNNWSHLVLPVVNKRRHLELGMIGMV